MNNSDFDLLLASCIHDMKNALTLVLNSVDQLGEEGISEERSKLHRGNLRYEASRLNNDLIHLLGVYRLRDDSLPVLIDEHEVWETVNDQYLKNEKLLEKFLVSFSNECDDEEIWYYDHELVGGVINNIIVNTVRYTHDQLIVRSFVENDYLCIQVCDDGPGFPENMLIDPEHPQKGMDFRNGSTSLGIYFAGRIARMHNRHEHTGFIKLENGGPLGGGVFSLYLP